MSEIFITDDLAFAEDPCGATLLYKVFGADVGDVFQIGISKMSLQGCRSAIDNDNVSWQIGDKSLKVTGTRDAIVLTFTLQGPPGGTRSIELSGKSLEAFRAALGLLSE